VSNPGEFRRAASQQVDDFRRGESVEGLATLRRVLHQAATLETSEMLGHSGLGAARRLHQIGHTVLTVKQREQDRHSGAIGEPMKQPCSMSPAFSLAAIIGMHRLYRHPPM
jgi:hypothetical protein